MEDSKDGEIVVFGPQLARYHNKPEKAKVFVEKMDNGSGPVMDNDDDGYLYKPKRDSRRNTSWKTVNMFTESIE